MESYALCGQCGSETNATFNRLVRDSCGHAKCRACLLREDLRCAACQPDVLSAHQAVAPAARLPTAPASCQSTTPATCQTAYQKPPSKHKPFPPHIHVTTSELGKQYECTICNRKFRSRSHVAYHASCSRSGSFCCPLCHQTFTRHSHFTYHMNVHAGNKTYICDACGATFSQRSKLIRHLLVHSGVRAHCCGQCPATFSSAAALQRHGLRHSGLQPLACPVCGRRFRDASNLRKHHAQHSGARYSCSECGKKYKLKWSLVKHHKSHSKERPWACSECPSTFHAKKDKIRHELIHSDIKRFQCHLCETTFRRKDNLDRHSRNTHSGVLQQAPSTDLHAFTTSQTTTDHKDVLDHSKPTFTKHMANKLCFHKHSNNESEVATRTQILEANNKRQSVIFKFAASKITEKLNIDFPSDESDSKTLPKSDISRELAAPAHLPPLTNNITLASNPIFCQLDNVQKSIKPIKKTINVSDVYKQMFPPKSLSADVGNSSTTPTTVEMPWNMENTKKRAQYVHKKVHYDLKKYSNKNELDGQFQNNQVHSEVGCIFPPVLPKEFNYPPKKDISKNYFSPESIELYKKILIPSYKSSAEPDSTEGPTLRHPCTNPVAPPPLAPISQHDTSCTTSLPTGDVLLPNLISLDTAYHESTVDSNEHSSHELFANVSLTEHQSDVHWRRRLAHNSSLFS